MSPHPAIPRPTKRELGAGYLAGVGMALAVSLAGYVQFTRESPLTIFVGTVMALALVATIAYIGYLFVEVGLSEQFVWTVAQWTALGLGGAALFSLAIGFGWLILSASSLLPSLLVVTVAAGGVVGTLLGVVAGLRNQHRRMRRLTQRNKVMNRVLRHNIKNEMNIIEGHASLLAEDGRLGDHDSLEAIRRAAAEVTSLGEAARKIDTLADCPDDGPVDLVALCEESLDHARRVNPDAELAADLPPAAWADAGPVVRSAITNVVENAVEHNDRTPRVRVTVSADGESPVEVSVADNGPGIPTDQREVLHRGDEEPIHHGNGLGLWLVKWIADAYGGGLELEENDPRGTVVRLTLPAADPPRQPAAEHDDITVPAGDAEPRLGTD